MFTLKIHKEHVEESDTPNLITENYEMEENAIKAALCEITEDNGVFTSKEEMEKVKKELELGEYIDEKQNKTYIIEKSRTRDYMVAEYTWEYFYEPPDA